MDVDYNPREFAPLCFPLRWRPVNTVVPRLTLAQLLGLSTDYDGITQLWQAWWEPTPEEVHRFLRIEKININESPQR